jgi:hypothetical protein
MSFGVSTVLQEYLIFHRIEVSQMMNWSTPLHKAHCANRNGYITLLYLEPGIKIYEFRK